MSARTRRQRSSDYKLLCGTCPDEQCKARLFFPGYEKSVECSQCGQRHEQSLLHNVAEVTNPGVALHNLLKNILLGNSKPKKGPDSVKVLGLSNYVCKLISPVLSTHGMDRKTGSAKLLKAMGQGDIFDCGRILCDRAFLIEEENLGVIGYGKDRSGSLQYLSDTLHDIVAFNDGQSTLIPIHADGDGHCLVHAVSRALVGRELFWHALRMNLGKHLQENIEKYKLLFKDFVDTDEWEVIIDECDPYYIPPEGEPLGLRNIHIFGLANVLKRPIILLDSKSGMQSFGDYSGVFLPGFVAPEECKGRDGTLNKPLCIAWSSSGRNHYIPLVGVKGKTLPRLPSYMLQKAWGMNKEEINKYVEFDNMHRCVVGGDKCLSDKYIQQLVAAMEKVFLEQYDVHPALVADVHQYIYKSSGIVGVLPVDVIERTQYATQENILYRCLTCEALVEYRLSQELFQRDGSLYKLAKEIYKELRPDKLYSFPSQGAVCSYDKERDCLVPDMDKSNPSTCAFCSGEMIRKVCADGTMQYKDGDRTTTPSHGSKCICGFKHYWNGKEYDNLPETYPISLQWAGRTVQEEVCWFQHESDPSLNSNVYEVAQAVVQKHFPGEFGSERLVQSVVDTILTYTAAASKREEAEEKKTTPETDAWSSDTASKIILTGHARKTLHKEELTKSEKEKSIKSKILTNAPKQQQRKITEPPATSKPQVKKKSPPVTSASKTGSPKSSPSKSVPSPTPSTSKEETQPQAASAEKKVKLATSDGRQVMLTLLKDVTYAELQKLIYEAVEVPANQQRIRLGFPPKVILPPKDGADTEIIPLKHGDKVSLEIMYNIPLPTPAPAQGSVHVQETSPPHPQQPQRRDTWGSFEESTSSQSAEKLLQALKQTQTSGDSIDTSVASLTIMSALAGKDLWTYVQTMPHLFSVGGLLYNQVKRDLGLIDGKHCQLPTLPGKVFRYNGKEDRLELCLEPYGHFPVEPDIENKVKEGMLLPGHDGPVFRFGTSGAIHHGSDHVAFMGQGHSMKASVNERMPQDLMCANPKPQARGIHDLCSPHNVQDSIQEEPYESMQVDQGLEGQGESEVIYHRRLGPGFSVVDPVATNFHNDSIEMFRALAQSIEKTLSEEMEEEKEDQVTAEILSGAASRQMPMESVAMETAPLTANENCNQGEGAHGSASVAMDVDQGQAIIKTDNISDNMLTGQMEQKAESVIQLGSKASESEVSMDTDTADSEKESASSEKLDKNQSADCDVSSMTTQTEVDAVNKKIDTKTKTEESQTVVDREEPSSDQSALHSPGSETKEQGTADACSDVTVQESDRDVDAPAVEATESKVDKAEEEKKVESESQSEEQKEKEGTETEASQSKSSVAELCIDGEEDKKTGGIEEDGVVDRATSCETKTGDTDT